MPLEPIALETLEKRGLGLARCEDVVVARDGRVWASDQQSACAEILADGSLRRVGAAGGAPNGINMDAEGRILIANFGVYVGEDGPLQRLDTGTGTIEVLASEVDGQRLTACNYPTVARDGTIYCTHSTFAMPWPKALDGRTDGFVFRVTPDGAGMLVERGHEVVVLCPVTDGSRRRYTVEEDDLEDPASLRGHAA